MRTSCFLFFALVACGPGDDPDPHVDAGPGDGMQDAPVFSCDPALQTGCTGSAACYSDLYLSSTGDPAYYCAAAGAGTQGTSCAADTDCAAGYWCLEYRDPNDVTVKVCSEYCRTTTPGLNHGCSGPKTCIETTGAPFGYCI